MGCTRAKNGDVTKVNIQLPAAQNASSSKITSQATTGTTSNGSSIAAPTGFMGDRPINCYLVAAGGPEEGMNKNTCFSRNNINPNLGQRKIGVYVGAAPAGNVISLDVPSGKDRTVFIVGFYAPDITYCRSFKDFGFPNGTLSDPYLLGEKTGLEMKVGDTMDLPIPVTYNQENAIDCTGPDFPQNNGGGNSGPQVEAKNIAAEFYNSVGNNQCQPMRVHLYTDTAGVANYNVTHSATHVVGLPAASATVTNLSFYNSEADCSASTGSITSVSLAANVIEQNIWFKAGSNSATNTPTPLTFTSTTGLTYIQNRSLYVTSAASQNRWMANSTDYMDASQCRDMIAYSVDYNGVNTPSTDSIANIAITDLAGNVISNGVTVVDNCTSQTTTSTVTLSGSKLRANFGLKTPVTPVSNFKVVVTSPSYNKGGETIINPIVVAAKFDMTVDSAMPWVNGTTNNVYAGDCFASTIFMRDASNNVVTAPAPISLNLNPGTGIQPFGDSICTAPLPPTLVIPSGSNGVDVSYMFNYPGSYSYDVNSPLVTNMVSGSYNIMATPVTSLTGIMLHAVADSLRSGSVNSWPSTSPYSSLPAWDIFAPPLFSNGPSQNHTWGIQLTGSNGQDLTKTMDFGGAASTTMILFSGDANTTGKLIEVGSVGGTTYNNVGINAAGNFTLNGNDTALAWQSSTWYDISFSHDGGTGCTLIFQIHGSGSPQTYNGTCNSFGGANTGSVTISSQTSGWLKSAIFANQSYDATTVNQVFNYFMNRFP